MFIINWLLIKRKQNFAMHIFCMITTESFHDSEGKHQQLLPQSKTKQQQKKFNLYASSVVNDCNNIDSGLHLVDIQIDGCERFSRALGTLIYEIGCDGCCSTTDRHFLIFSITFFQFFKHLFLHLS